MLESSKDILKEFASQYLLSPRILVAILDNESNCEGFNKDGSIKKRFEPHIYSSFIIQRDTGRRNPILPAITPEFVKSHNTEEIRLLSTSFGMAQIMGWHYPMLNYTFIGDMVQAWTNSEEIQIRDFCLFCVKYRDGKFLQALQTLNFKSIAKMYNGAGYERNSYDTRLHKGFNVAVV